MEAGRFQKLPWSHNLRFPPDSREMFDIGCDQVIRSASFLVHPDSRVTAALDPDDNIYLEFAQAADAGFRSRRPL
jgi:hypothetical protein